MKLTVPKIATAARNNLTQILFWPRVALGANHSTCAKLVIFVTVFLTNYLLVEINLHVQVSYQCP